MRTDQLISELSSDQAPRANPGLRVAAAIATGWLAAVAGLAVVEGPPMAAVAHTGSAAFAVKLGYALSLGSLTTVAALAAGRPGRTLAGPIALIAVPILLLLAVSLIELASADRAAWPGMLFGSHYWSCFASVSLASLPVFVGMMWAYRILAPTRLALAGFLVGLSSGAAGAVAFALYCHETTAAFLMTAYTPAMLIPAALGALVARPLLRW
jgi:hypothetical protein